MPSQYKLISDKSTILNMPGTSHLYRQPTLPTTMSNLPYFGVIWRCSAVRLSQHGLGQATFSGNSLSHFPCLIKPSQYKPCLVLSTFSHMTWTSHLDRQLSLPTPMSNNPHYWVIWRCSAACLSRHGMGQATFSGNSLSHNTCQIMPFQYKKLYLVLSTFLNFPLTSHLDRQLSLPTLMSNNPHYGVI